MLPWLKKYANMLVRWSDENWSFMDLEALRQHIVRLKLNKSAVSLVYTCSLYTVVVHVALFSQTWLGQNKRRVSCSLAVLLKQPSQLLFCMNQKPSLGHCFVRSFVCMFVFTPDKYSWHRRSRDSQRYYNIFIENLFFDSKVCQAQREKHTVVTGFCPEGKLWWNVTHGSW